MKPKHETINGTLIKQGQWRLLSTAYGTYPIAACLLSRPMPKAGTMVKATIETGVVTDYQEERGRD